MPKKASGSVKKIKEKDIKINSQDSSNVDSMSRDELRELLLINTYKLALTRAQIDAIMEILIKKGITTYDDVWKKTNEIFKENKRE